MFKELEVATDGAVEIRYELSDMTWSHRVGDVNFGIYTIGPLFAKGDFQAYHPRDLFGSSDGRRYWMNSPGESRRHTINFENWNWGLDARVEMVLFEVEGDTERQVFETVIELGPHTAQYDGRRHAWVTVTDGVTARAESPDEAPPMALPPDGVLGIAVYRPMKPAFFELIKEVDSWATEMRGGYRRYTDDGWMLDGFTRIQWRKKVRFVVLRGEES